MQPWDHRGWWEMCCVVLCLQELDRPMTPASKTSMQQETPLETVGKTSTGTTWSARKGRRWCFEWVDFCQNTWDEWWTGKTWWNLPRKRNTWIITRTKTKNTHNVPQPLGTKSRLSFIIVIYNYYNLSYLSYISNISCFQLHYDISENTLTLLSLFEWRVKSACT